MATLTFADLYNFAARWANDTTTTGIARAKDAVAEANRLLAYGMQQPPLKPWWRKRTDSIAPVAGTQAYALPTAVGSFESIRSIWYRTQGNRYLIDFVDDEVWSNEVNENSSFTGVPSIANLFSDSGDTYKIQFNPIPSSAFISTIDAGLIRLDGWIEETLTASSGDAVEPLMPNARRMAIAYKAVELLGVMQGDTTLIAWASQMGKRYYEMIFSDDVTRTGFVTRQSRPMDPMGWRVGISANSDYGRPRR